MKIDKMAPIIMVKKHYFVYCLFLVLIKYIVNMHELSLGFSPGCLPHVSLIILTALIVKIDVGHKLLNEMYFIAKF